MINKRFTVILILFCCCILRVVAQGDIDSLLKRLPKVSDVEKATVYNKLGDLYIMVNHDECEKFLKQALSLAIQYDIPQEKANAYHNLGRLSKLQNDLIKAKKNFEKSVEIKRQIGDHEGLSKSLNQIGIILQGWGKFDEVLPYYENSYKEAEIAGYLRGMAIALNQQANFYTLIGNYKVSIKKYLQALESFKKMNDVKGIISTNNNIGLVYNKLENRGEAIYYHYQALELAQASKADLLNGEKNRFQLIAEAYNNIGIIYIDPDTSGNKNMYFDIDKGLEYIKKAMEYFKKANYQQGIASNLHNLSMTYFNKKDYLNSIKYSMESIELANALKNKYELMQNYTTIGVSYGRMNNKAKAIENLLIGVEIARETDSREGLFDAYRYLSEVYLADKDYKNAYYYLSSSYNIKDSLKGEQMQKIMQEMSTKYQTAQKEQQIKEANLKNESQKKQNEFQQKLLYAISAFFIIVLLFAVFAIWQYLQKRKANQKLHFQNIEISRKNEEIEAQRNQVVAQRDLIEDQKKGIMDSIHYASRIQRAILPSKEYLKDLLGDKHFILYKPRDIVSGDFFWVGNRNRKIIVVAADCTGHGVPGAFMSMLGTAFLNEITSIMVDRLEASFILNQLRDNIITSLKQTGKQGEQKDGMDLSLYILDQETLTVEFAGANNPLFILRTNPEINENWENGRISQEIFTSNNGESIGLIHIKADKMPIGIFSEQRPFESIKIQLQKGDSLYNFSDGYVDQFGGPENKKFMTKRFKKLLVEIKDLPMFEQKQRMNNAIEDWKAGREQIDDILVIGIKV